MTASDQFRQFQQITLFLFFFLPRNLWFPSSSHENPPNVGFRTLPPIHSEAPGLVNLSTNDGMEEAEKIPFFAINSRIPF